ncbi:MAG: 1-deoxy-D-xylulose-5-phosphate synthase, partial [Actinobacteria bacterium]|nr:1-deoxy-D-xylulose-5-phosphate synthase [Actinomycetota bacterium]
SKLSSSLTTLRLNPTYVATRERLRQAVRDIPGLGSLAYQSIHGITSAFREVVTPHTFFENLGVRYVGPIDGHDIAMLEDAFRHAQEWDGPIVVHVLTEKGRGYAPAEADDIQRLHDFKVALATPDEEVAGTDPLAVKAATYTDAFSRALIGVAEVDSSIVALTAAMPGPTGLLPFQERFPARFIDVGIAEGHEVTAAAGLAMGGMRPVVCVYSTFFSRAFDHANLDVGLHGLPVVFVLDRAGITGDDGPSHHGIFDLVLTLAIPGMTVFAPSTAGDVAEALRFALTGSGPASIRFPKTPPKPSLDDEALAPLQARLLKQGNKSVAIVGVGKMRHAATTAIDILSAQGIAATLWDPRIIRPADPEMIADLASHQLVITVEDGLALGGAGSHLAAAIETAASSKGIAGPKIHSLGIPHRFLSQGQADKILASLGLDGIGIAEATIAAFSELQAK